MDPRLCDAIAHRQLVMFGYGGTVRVVEPHLYGASAAGDELLSAWLRPGWSQADPDGGWRMYRLDAVVDLQALPERFDAPRPDFNPRDPHFAERWCVVYGPEGPGPP